MSNLPSFYSLVKYNGGEFKSEKQAKYLLRNGTVQSFYQTAKFGWDEAVKTVGWEVTVWLDTTGVVKIVKHLKKGDVVAFERTSSSMADSLALIERKNAFKSLDAERDIISNRIARIQRKEKRIRSMFEKVTHKAVVKAVEDGLSRDEIADIVEQIHAGKDKADAVIAALESRLTQRYLDVNDKILALQ